MNERLGQVCACCSARLSPKDANAQPKHDVRTQQQHKEHKQVTLMGGDSMYLSWAVIAREREAAPKKPRHKCYFSYICYFS